MKKVLALVLVVCVVVGGLGVDAYASIIDFPWTVTFEDSNRVFVAIPGRNREFPSEVELGESFWERRRHPHNMSEEEWQTFAREFYSRSEEEMQALAEAWAWQQTLMQIRPGLYYKGTSLVNIYYMDEYEHLPQYGTFFADEGIYFVSVRSHPHWPSYWPSYDNFPYHMRGLDAEAVRFFANGKLVRSYRLSDLVTDESRLEYTMNGLTWIQTLIHDPQTDTVTLQTQDGHTYTFDIISGEKITPPEQTPLTTDEAYPTNPTDTETLSQQSPTGHTTYRVERGIRIPTALIIAPIALIAFIIIRIKKH